MPKGPKTNHVVPNSNGGWDKKRGGAGRATSHHQTKREAIEVRRQISRWQRTELRTHKKGRRIAGSDSYGGDSVPRKADGGDP